MPWHRDEWNASFIPWFENMNLKGGATLNNSSIHPSVNWLILLSVHPSTHSDFLTLASHSMCPFMSRIFWNVSVVLWETRKAWHLCDKFIFSFIRFVVIIFQVSSTGITDGNSQLIGVSTVFRLHRDLVRPKFCFGMARVIGKANWRWHVSSGQNLQKPAGA